LNAIANSKDVTYDQLKAFIKNDATDKEPYDLNSQVCAQFAKQVHDNAEINGIRCGYVAISFNETTTGHACDVFNTTDKGFVFVDCTGTERVIIPGTSFQNSTSEKDYDKIAYISIGEEYATIPMSVALGFDYSYYEEYTLRRESYNNQLDSYNTRMKAFNEEVRQYEAARGGRTVIGNVDEYARLKIWRNKLLEEEGELKQLKSGLDVLKSDLAEFYFEPLGVVKEIEIYW
jgi:hypothetical protein